jgi:hypothetical protein
MPRQQKRDAKEFRELTFAEQEKSIAAAINNLQAAIELHVEHSPHRGETIEKCLIQVERLSRRLRDFSRQHGAEASSGRTTITVEAARRVHVGGPRLARPEQAPDFTMEVSEESRDAGLR